MRKIEIKSWGKTVGDKGAEENFLMVLKALINSQRQETVKGLDKFRLFGRLAKAFEKAWENKILELEESEYSFLKALIEKEIPGQWAMQKEVLENVEIFMESKPEK